MERSGKVSSTRKRFEDFAIPLYQKLLQRKEKKDIWRFSAYQKLFKIYGKISLITLQRKVEGRSGGGDPRGSKTKEWEKAASLEKKKKKKQNGRQAAGAMAILLSCRSRS